MCRFISGKYGLMLVALAMLACGDGQSSDTCTIGENMTNPRLVAGLEPAPGGSVMRITWDPGTRQGAELPSDYFAAVQLSSETTTELQGLIPSVSLTGEREISVRFRNLGPYLSTHDNTLDFSLAFPDRRDFISCRHAGMDDAYLLKVHLEFNEQQQLKHAELAEDLTLGDI
ncbi:hypothetical protein [Hyalangium sp.]|uniref:hypothetical protein n=1 Tax=Hyalangium sp. TaxID=2028555 RepID=UPI002D56FE30|nr:hypothetical protein [Hyalangium sp.]HYH98559.1 hypothetical protein [Hyalangium sp.]